MIDLKNYSNYSIWQSWNLGNATIPEKCDHLSFQDKQAYYQNNNTVKNLKRFLNEHHPKGLKEIIIDIISLTAFRNYILSRSLNKIAPRINALAQKILQDPVFQKAKLVERAITILNNKDDKSKLDKCAQIYFANVESALKGKIPEDTPIAELDQKVQEYLQNALKELNNNKNIPLPGWFHATEDISSVRDILDSKKIINRGKCACASSVDEYRDYGPFTVALDYHNALKDKVVYYYYKGKNDWNRHEMIWIHTGSQSIRADSESVAFIIVPQNEREEMAKKLAVKNVMVVTRKFSEHLRNILTLAENTIEFTEKTEYVPGKVIEREINARRLPHTWINTWSDWQKYEAAKK